jgi:uncharacterized lipoprotein YbaY/heat shock protein HslJ/uncharacterized lipoprotein NlpE involved in copper resistance
MAQARRLGWLKPLALVLAMTLGLGACAHDGRIIGTATYRERIALPPNAVFEAWLEDVSLADAPAKTVNSVTISNPGNPPINFSIPFTAKDIDQRHRYSVRGAIRLDDRLLMTTDTAAPVITQGMPDAVTLLLKAVPQRPAPETQALEHEAPPLPDRFIGAHGLNLPATYEGVLPCGDCPGTRWHLNLMPDQTFYLKMEYLERGGYLEDSGRWYIETPEKRLMLSGRGGTGGHFAIDGDTLRTLDAQGKPIEAPSLNFALKRADSFTWFDVTNPMRGTFAPSRDGGTFTDCVSGHSYPVAGNIQLLSGAAGGGAITLDIKARITRPQGAADAILMPLDIIQLHPGEGCEQHRAAAPLTETYWRLVKLEGDAVRVMEGRREPHIILHAEGHQFAATMGCNQMGGTYAVKENTITFSQVRSTLMACIGPASELEARFKDWLSHTATWRLNGQSLTITTAVGASALFEAVYFV